jgi:hypothetical protein
MVFSVSAVTSGSKAAHPPRKSRHKDPRKASKGWRISTSFIKPAPALKNPFRGRSKYPPEIYGDLIPRVTRVFVPE